MYNKHKIKMKSLIDKQSDFLGIYLYIKWMEG